MKKANVPLVSILYTLVLISYFYLLLNPELMVYYQLPSELFKPWIPEYLLLIFAFILLIELRLSFRRVGKYNEKVLALNQRINELMEEKKQLRTSAHVYAGHADKLKLFISDKLLEYIEYDEKFLHFKSIASEVRHNGVISYDKIFTLLEGLLADSENKKVSDSGELQDAIQSLKYLWDLLDLSTADNIALHIASQVCEYEELFFQRELGNQSFGKLPDLPVFESQTALSKALGRCYGSTPEYLANDMLYVEGQDLLRVYTEKTDRLLGNENHIVLALENLINNAQFFAGRRGGRRSEKRAEIAIELEQEGNIVQYHIFNRGPHIDNETANKLFHLGYSTRRVKQHHGKGLGLYFVNEILKGYDGSVSFNNIYNRTGLLSIRVELESGESFTDVVEILLEDEQPCCRKSGSIELQETISWDVNAEVYSVEVTQQNDQKTYRFEKAQLLSGKCFDPGQKGQPRWSLSVDSHRNQSRLNFKVLDIAGVKFTLSLPSLSARLDGNILDPDLEGMEQEVASISGRFRALEE